MFGPACDMPLDRYTALDVLFDHSTDARARFIHEISWQWNALISKYVNSVLFRFKFFSMLWQRVMEMLTHHMTALMKKQKQRTSVTQRRNVERALLIVGLG